MGTGERRLNAAMTGRIDADTPRRLAGQPVPTRFAARLGGRAAATEVDHATAVLPQCISFRRRAWVDERVARAFVVDERRSCGARQVAVVQRHGTPVLIKLNRCARDELGGSPHHPVGIGRTAGNVDHGAAGECTYADNLG